MKNILITGKNSYIGKSLENWLMRQPDKYNVDTIDMKEDSWKEKDFSLYDVVFHVAGIAHIKETSGNRNLYYKVNRDLAYETAQKAKLDGVRHFIFLSSMSVYGLDKGMIDNNTNINPNSAYGKSKAEAETLIFSLDCDLFKISILRPPMVYGKGCRGNYMRLSKLAIKIPIFPKIDNKRSMIYIDNLSEFIKQIIDNQSGGVFFPQNSEYINTSEMVSFISEVHGKKIMLTSLWNPLLGLLNSNTINKLFGSLFYDMEMSKYISDYNICGFKESIEKSESRN